MALADFSNQFSEGKLQKFRQLIDHAMQASGNILRATRQRDTELGHQSTRFTDSRDPGSLLLRADSVQALQRYPPPMMRGRTAFHDQLCWWGMEQKMLKLASAESLSFDDASLFISNRNLKNEFCQINTSMSRRGNCWDNAVAESFFGSLKKERIRQQIYQTRDQARADIFDYKEMFYNRRRRHSHLGDISPETFEKASNCTGAVSV